MGDKKLALLCSMLAHLRRLRPAESCFDKDIFCSSFIQSNPVLMQRFETTFNMEQKHNMESRLILQFCPIRYNGFALYEVHVFR